MNPIGVDDTLTLRPRLPVRTTPLGEPAHQPLIIHPAADAAWGRLAARLVDALAARGVTATASTDLALMPERSTPLPASCRNRPLIVLGALGLNRVLQPHYAAFLCATDADYPGPSGSELRTLVDPYHTGCNLILAGGSSPATVARAVAQLEAEIAAAPAGVVLPWLLQVKLDPALADRFAAWPHTPLDEAASRPPTVSGYYFFADLIRTFSSYTHMWWLTADRRYAEVALINLRMLNAHVKTTYGDWHYLGERFLRALPLLIGGGWLTEADMVRTHELLLGTALATQNDWWRMRHGGPPLGHRHQGKGTYEFLLLARCLRDTTDASPALVAQCDRWIEECQAFLDSLVRAGIDDQDDESTFNNIAQLFRYALGEERPEFFTDGHARRAAERAVALHDNLGCGAGQGGYGEGLSMYYQQEAATQVAGSAFYYGDGELKWIFRHLPRLAEPQRFMPFQHTPTFVHQFATGAEVEPRPPRRFCGLSVLPATPHEYLLCTQPPVHVEPRGHLANAPETWLTPEGVGLTRLPRADAIDKVLLRGGFAPTDPYLLLQGYQGGFRWQGHMKAANCIVRFAQGGHVWLVQNTVRHAPYDKNGLQLSDDTGPHPLPPLAAWVGGVETDALVLATTRLTDCGQARWTRHLFWSRPGEGWFVVIDQVDFAEAGQHSLTCTWRTPAWAELNGRRWTTLQGRHRFTLVSGDAVPTTSEEETNQGASRPFVLRQRRMGRHQPGDTVTFQNLFHVRAQADPEESDLVRLDARNALVRQAGRNVAWCGVDLAGTSAWLAGMTLTAATACLTESSLALAAATALTLPELSWQSSAPVGVALDLATGRLVITADANASVVVQVAGVRHDITGNDTVSLPDGVARALAAHLRTGLAALSPPPLEAPPPAASAGVDWPTRWVQTAGPEVPERIRRLCITAEPPPLDGIAQQLIDTIPPQSREIVGVWPAAPRYDINLQFPTATPVESISLLGDCTNEPTLRTFAPLPEGIEVEAEAADGSLTRVQPVPVRDRLFKRIYVDLAVSLQHRFATINQTVHALRVHIPAPARRGPFVLHEIEVRGTRRQPPAVKHWCVEDLDDDGAREIVLGDASGRICVLDDRGRERWARSLGLEATHLSVQPVGEGGAQAVCVALIDGSLHILAAADGRQLVHTDLAAELATFKDRLMGICYVVNSLAVWHRDESGRGWLVAGGYGLMLFLDHAGKILGHSWADGAWVSRVLVLPPGHPSAGDIYACSGWNHGIGHYRTHPGTGPSGVVQSWGGFRQPMFRELRKVIPFVNGPRLAFTLTTGRDQPDGAIFAAAELGFGVLSLATGEWLWQHTVANRLQAARLVTDSRTPWVAIGGADGFVTAFDSRTGSRQHAWLAAAPVVALLDGPNGAMLAATRAGLQLLDGDGRETATLVRPLRRAISLDERRILLERDDHRLELLELPA